MSDFKKLAGELAKESIVTMALARFLEQVIRTIHEEEIEPLRREAASLRKALKKILRANDAFVSAMPNEYEGDSLTDACDEARALLGDVGRPNG
jgi:hypothetical protein